MIIAKYPEWVEAQLKILDERIEEIYREYAELKVRPDEVMRIKENLYEQTKPFVDEKVKLIANSCPTYIVEGALEQISHLTDRPCSVCEFHKEDGCNKWECVFEGSDSE